MRKEEILPLVTTGMDSEAITLTEVSQRQTLYDFTCSENLKHPNSETESRMEVTRYWGDVSQRVKMSS